jgi:hypothetical protein
MSIESLDAGEAEMPIGEFTMFASASTGKSLAITLGTTGMQGFPAGSLEQGLAGIFLDSWTAIRSVPFLNRFKYRTE